MPKRYVMLVKTDADANNNKFYEITLGDDDVVTARWGRVGVKGSTMVKGNGDHVFNSVERGQRNKGYKSVDVAVQSESGPAPASLKEAAVRDLVGSGTQDPAVVALIERLVRINAHQLMVKSGGQISIINGQVRTPLGLVTLDSVHAARALLLQLEALVNRGQLEQRYRETLESYLTKVPQKVPARRGWDAIFFSEFTSFARQHDLLDQLESSVALAQTQAAQAGSKPATAVEKMFHYQIALDEDSQMFKKINDFFRKTQQRMHPCSHLELKRIYTIQHPVADPAFEAVEKKIGNVHTLWHGTRAHNILSIFKSGLLIPARGTSITITGRLFGNGLYFSDQSTKALNYSHGYWDQGPRENNCFMFLCDVALGKVFKTSGALDVLPTGFDSCLAPKGISIHYRDGTRPLQNNETIVYKTQQARLRYLCEFDA
jgi:poly [ADP-ribose] polymerase 2/3/4